jgi:predicted O-methyltransferase YrrM
MIEKLKRIPSLIRKPLRATAHDLASLDVPEEVKAALRQPVPAEMPAARDSVDVASVLALPASDSSRLFTSSAGQRYPCWLDGDESLGDDWLLSADYYPYYQRLYQYISRNLSKVRFLEIGVRTGYSGVVMAKAAPSQAIFYAGVDPNLYIPDGLEKAASTFRLLQEEGHPLNFFLLEGYSGSSAIQNSLNYSGPFDIIHIDGEHSYFGKLFDLWIARNLLAKGGFVLVDDFEHHGFIADSVKVALQRGWFSKFTYFPTKRGLAVLS